jgi:hypothetical protein
LAVFESIFTCLDATKWFFYAKFPAESIKQVLSSVAEEIRDAVLKPSLEIVLPSLKSHITAKGSPIARIDQSALLFLQCVQWEVQSGRPSVSGRALTTLLSDIELFDKVSISTKETILARHSNAILDVADSYIGMNYESYNNY